MAKFRILHISNNLDEYPHCVKDSDEFPHVVDWVKDEYEMFVLDVDGGSIFPAADFFYMFDVDEIKTFSTETQALEDELHVATNFIRSVRSQCGQAKTAKDEHMACWAVVTESPILINNRIGLSEKDKTYLAMKRKE